MNRVPNTTELDPNTTELVSRCDKINKEIK